MNFLVDLRASAISAGTSANSSPVWQRSDGSGERRRTIGSVARLGGDQGMLKKLRWRGSNRRTPMSAGPRMQWIVETLRLLQFGGKFFTLFTHIQMKSTKKWPFFTPKRGMNWDLSGVWLRAGHVTSLFARWLVAAITNERA